MTLEWTGKLLFFFSFSRGGVKDQDWKWDFFCTKEEKLKRARLEQATSDAPKASDQATPDAPKATSASDCDLEEAEKLASDVNVILEKVNGDLKELRDDLKTAESPQADSSWGAPKEALIEFRLCKTAGPEKSPDWALATAWCFDSWKFWIWSTWLDLRRWHGRGFYAYLRWLGLLQDAFFKAFCTTLWLCYCTGDALFGAGSCVTWQHLNFLRPL